MIVRDWKSTLGVLLVFVLGLLAGSFLTLSLVHHRVVQMLQRGSPAYEQFLEKSLSRGLHLDAGQREKFHEALVANIEERKKIQQQVQPQIQPQIQQVNEQTRQEIRGILQPDQLATLRRNLEDFRRRFGTPGLGGAPREQEADSGTNVPPIAGTNVPSATN
jgi:uncharacterized iron-regulated membrane protein